MVERNAPQVSVIIPTYNREETIGRTIRSVLTQTFQDFEIIVVDDGSTDGTRAIVEGFCDPRIRCLRHEQNLGAAAARNTGIRAARGTYLAFLDSDDEWLPEKLSEQISILQSAPDGTYASCTGYYLHVGSSGLVLETIPHQPPSWLKQLLLGGCALSPGATLVVKKTLFDDVGLFDGALSRFEDWDWLIRYVKKYRLVVLEKPLARVYLGGCPDACRLERSTAHFMTKYRRDFQTLGGYSRRKVTARLWFQVADAFYRERQFGKGSLYFLKALFQNPIQRPGLYLHLADAVLGTSLAFQALRYKQVLLRR